MPAKSPSTKLHLPGTVIVWAALLVGTLDICSAFADYWLATGRGPEGVLRYVASGAFGSAAFTGGNSMIWYGLLFHYVIAAAWTVLFFWLYRKLALLSGNRLLTGFVYGLFIWAMMNLALLPLSQVRHVPLSAMQPLKALKAFLILTAMIGWPLSFIAQRYCTRLAGKKIKP
jgi:hypothetical protein